MRIKNLKKFRLQEMNSEQRKLYAIWRYMFPIRILVIVLAIFLLVRL